MLKKDKVKIIDEEMNDEKIRRFLTLKPYGEESADFYVLTKAYRGLPIEYFATFLKMFLAEGRDINAKNAQDQSFVSFIEGNSNFLEFVELLKSNGAQ
ncbi:MAG: PA4642 family protein [Pseudomonadales bacterium]|nr:PA4642 family protein [Pseudomonadales bacterium]